MNDTAQSIKAKTLQTVKVNGEKYLIRKPGLRTLIRCGIQRLTFSHEKASTDRLRKLIADPTAMLAEMGGDLEKFVDEFEPELKFYAKLCEQCMVDPKIWDGPIETCPDGFTTLDQIEDDFATIGAAIMKIAGLEEALAAAKAAETFRTDTGGDSDRTDREVLPSPAEPVAEGVAG